MHSNGFHDPSPFHLNVAFAPSAGEESATPR
jgi:hypothetical protein